MENVGVNIKRKVQDSWKGLGNQRTWSSLFGRKLGGKSFSPLITLKSCWEKVSFKFFCLDPIIDFSASSMEFTLMGKFMGARPNIETLKKWLKKWPISGQVDITPTLTGLFSFFLIAKKI